MEKNKRNKIIGLSIGILIVLIIVVSSTYAYWQITRTQETPNDIVAACLDLNLEDKSAAIDLDSAWPISDDEASSLTGYTFKVTNNCDEEINYIVGLNRVEESNYLQDSSIKVRLDENSSFTYGDLNDVEYADSENTYTSRVSKQVSVETISANGTNEHTIRVWVSEDAPVTEQSKIFQGQVFITGGQGIEVKECFTIANNGTILGYDESCGLNVKVPAEINGIHVKSLNSASFSDWEFAQIVAINNETQEEVMMLLVKKNHEVIFNAFKQQMCDEVDNCDLSQSGLVIFESVEQYNEYDWETYTENYFFARIYYDGEAAFPTTYYPITSLDLSDAVYLENIGEGTFNASYYSATPVDDSCIYESSPGAYECGGSLASIEFPQNGVLKTIGYNAFRHTKITNITIPSSVETIDDYAFYKNSLLTSVTFEDTESNPSNLKTIGDASFEKNNLTKVVIPSSVTSIYKSFLNNDNLTEVIIKNTEGNITLTAAFPTTATITYDPNYTE